MMNSFNVQELVIQYVKSDIEGLRVSALLTLSRLARMYAAASLVAEQVESESNQVSSASSYLWQDLNPATRGIHIPPE